jgi:hypothetical protein
MQPKPFIVQDWDHDFPSQNERVPASNKGPVLPSVSGQLPNPLAFISTKKKKEMLFS